MPIVAVPPIRDLGTVPNNNMDEATFNVTAENFTTQMAPWGGDVKAVAESAKTNAEYSNERAVNANTSAETAAARLADVQTAANGAFAAANYKGEWSTLTGALNVPATVTHLGRLWYLKLNLANVTSQAPALGSTYWGEVSRNDFTVLACPAGSTNAADRGMYRMTAATSVLVLPASPFHGMVVAAVNVSGTLAPVIQRNGKTICGDAEDYLMNQLGWQIVLQYDSTSGDWLRVSGFTAFTPFSTNQPFNQANNWTGAQNFAGGLTLNGSPIIETGTNANGTFTKFADGTLLMTAVASLNMTTLAGLTQTFPASFVGDRPWVGFCGIAAQSGQENLRNCACLCGSNNWLIRTEVTVAGVTAYPIKLMAIGRWA
ncbi:hypothetical protein WH303_12670 [Comamonas sp. MYb69]